MAGAGVAIDDWSHGSDKRNYYGKYDQTRDGALVLDQIAREPYHRRGILNSEMALILHTVRQLGIECVIESGRAQGQSTYILAKYLPDVEINSIELRETPDEEIARARLRGLSNVCLWVGDGKEIIPRLTLIERPTAVLCDGPKGAAAVSILEQCFERPWVRAGFIHDMRKLDHGGPSPHRETAIERLPNHKFSDDPVLVAATSWMDAEVVKAGGPCGPQHEAEFGSYGPTIGVFINPKH